VGEKDEGTVAAAARPAKSRTFKASGSIRPRRFGSFQHCFYGDGTNRSNPKGILPDEMMRSYDYLAGRIRDIEIKLRIIIDGLQFQGGRRTKDSSGRIQIVQLRDEFIKLEVGRFRSIETQVAQYCTVKDAVLATLGVPDRTDEVRDAEARITECRHKRIVA
ncbi:unnamed protein product, partial [Sphagnum balticum]